MNFIKKLILIPVIMISRIQEAVNYELEPNYTATVLQTVCRLDTGIRYNETGFNTTLADSIIKVTTRWNKYINKYADEYRLGRNLIRSIIYHESYGNQYAVSCMGAGGLMQLMPGTAWFLGVYDVYNPEQNIDGGCKYLRWLMDEYGYNEMELMWAWNAGILRVQEDAVPPGAREFAVNVMVGKQWVDLTEGDN
jgi:membrane-bound lytic murein transglycosylase MltF